MRHLKADVQRYSASYTASTRTSVQLSQGGPRAQGPPAQQQRAGAHVFMGTSTNFPKE